MGGWTLEVFKMCLYMAFPVGLFHIFNQPEYFEEWVTNTKREIYPPEDLAQREQIQQAIRDIRIHRDKQRVKALEETENNKK